MTVGFKNGSFAVYQLDMLAEQTPAFGVRHVQGAGGIGRGTMVTAVASMGPFLSVVSGHMWDIYEFPVSQSNGGGIDSVGTFGGGLVDNDAPDRSSFDSPDSSSDDASDGSSRTRRMIPSPHLDPPTILSSLRSSTAWPPIALSLRRSINGTLLASIIYTHPLNTSGWSVGMQELRFSTSSGSHKTAKTSLVESRIATAVPSGFTSLATFGEPERSSGRGAAGMGGVFSITGHGGRSQWFDPPLAQPTSLSYCHP